MHSDALHIIRSIRKKWIAIGFVSYGLLALSAGLLLTFLYRSLCTSDMSELSTALYTLLLSAIAFSIFILIGRTWQLEEKQVVRFLNKNYPALEESCELLLREAPSLNLLEQLQYNRTTEALQNIGPPPLYYRLRSSLYTLGGSITVCLLMVLIAHLFHNTNAAFMQQDAAGVAAELPAGVSRVNITIVPPAYTHKAARKQQNMNLLAEEGAAIHWEIKMHNAVRDVQFTYNDSLKVKLHPDASHTIWKMDQVMDRSGFYQLQMDGNVSELYKIEVTRDQPPVIVISSPKPTTVIEIGEPARINLQAFVSDDYGVKDVSINATIAKGSGEGVKFKEQKLSFGTSFASQQIKYALEKTINLTALDMEPGDELYFYIDATDNHGQEKRSDIYIVSITDTARLMSMDGLLNGVNLKPDYFRSQRQIIIETEQLIKDKDTALVQNFNNRSNNLGIDQKLLRLRYGKFLGEEASSNENIPGDKSLDAIEFGDATQMLDAFTDKHDNAEDASFLDPETKKQLRATLNEMWSAELRLRMFKPQEALPFEYKALRLLKDLQQKSRAYVAKTSIKTSPIKLEKRLTGKLDKITEPVTHATIAPTAKPVEELRDALSVLEQLKKNKAVDERSLQTLRLASAQVSNHASKDPSLYIKPLEAIKRVMRSVQINQAPAEEDLLLSQKALQRIADAPLLLPSKKQVAPALSLSQQYFRNLKKNEQHR